MSRSDPRRVDDYLDHVLQAIANITEYTRDMELADFAADRKTQDAVIRNFEVIGEACNNVVKYHPDFAAAHPAVPWSFAYQMRNQLIHGYFKVDIELVWRTVRGDLHEVEAAVRVLRQSQSGAP